MSTNRAFAVAILLLACAGAFSPAAAQGCVSGGEGRQLVAEGEVAPFPDALARAGVSADQVVDVQLCQSGGGWVYRVRVLDAGGEVTSVNIPAG